MCHVTFHPASDCIRDHFRHRSAVARISTIAWQRGHAAVQPTGTDLGCRPQPALGRCRAAKQLEDLSGGKKLVRNNAAERPAADIVLLVEGSDAT